MIVKPITPSEAEHKKLNSIPPHVIECVNTLLVKNYSKSGSTTILQREILDLIRETMKEKQLPEPTNDEIIKYGWLDFEQIYYQAGWDVHYDKPSYNEQREAHFAFSRALVNNHA